MTKIIFWGTPNFVLPIPQALLSAEGCQLLAVVTNPDRPVGRKQILTPSPVKKWAQENKIPVLTPEKLDEKFPNILISQYPNLELGVLAAYGKIIPQEIINLFPKGILVIHPSLLPAWRGASPVQAAIVAGDRETGVSIIKMDEKMDHGPIIAQFDEEIKPDDTAETLYRRLFQITAQFLPQALLEYINFCADRHAKRYIKETPRTDRNLAVFLPPKDQNHKKATFTKILKKEDGFIPPGIIAPKPGQTSKWKLGPYNSEPTPKNIERFIRAMIPWPEAWTEVILPINTKTTNKYQSPIKKRLKILKAHLEAGKLILDQVQLEGRKPVSGQQFQETYPGVKLIP